MIADALISQIQLALIGIVVVFGLFYVWRSLHRMEDKLDRFLDTIAKSGGGMCLPGSNTCAFGWNGEDIPLPEDADDAAEEFMRTVFGTGHGGVVFSAGDAHGPSVPQKEPIVIEELSPAAGEEVAQPEAPLDATMDHVSEADTDTMNPLSKSKLKRMNLETLKDLCRERGLSVEGSKSVLTDRLLGLVRD